MLFFFKKKTCYIIHNKTRYTNFNYFFGKGNYWFVSSKKGKENSDKKRFSGVCGLDSFVVNDFTSKIFIVR